jgi:hypothetical protein
MQHQSTVAADHSPVNQGAEFLFRVAERFGLPVVILVMVLWWARHDIVQPLLDAHFTVVREIVEGQRQHSEEVQNVGRKLDELIEIQRSSK